MPQGPLSRPGTEAVTHPEMEGEKILMADVSI
jgi:hypothetical protein